MGKNDHKLTEAQWEIIQVVWEHEPCAAPTVQELLESRKGWSYSTVKTLMDRMVERGFLETERVRNLVLYRSAVSRSEAQRGELKRLVRRAFGGAFAPMVQSLLDSEELSEQELKQLEALIRRRRGRAAR